jgi:hypothetical protein
MEAVGEVKAESGDDHQDEDRCISHGTSVLTSDIAVEGGYKQFSDCYRVISECSLI